MLPHATGHPTDRSLFHKRFEFCPQCHRHPCPSFTGSLLLARGTKLPKNSSTLEGLGIRRPGSRTVQPQCAPRLRLRVPSVVSRSPRIFHFFGPRSPHNSRITAAGEGCLGTG